jgi:hypothetical protein
MSTSLHLDFVPKPAISLSGNSWLSWLILFISLLFAFFIWQFYQYQLNELLQINASLKQINYKPVKSSLPKNIVQVTISPEKKSQIQETVAALTLPWNTLLSSIEKPDMHDIALLSLTPNVKSQQIVIEAEAKNLQAALHYVDALQAQAVFDRVYLQKHSVEETDISKPVRFNVFAHWQLAE